MSELKSTDVECRSNSYSGLQNLLMCIRYEQILTTCRQLDKAHALCYEL